MVGVGEFALAVHLNAFVHRVSTNSTDNYDLVLTQRRIARRVAVVHNRSTSTGRNI